MESRKVRLALNASLPVLFYGGLDQEGSHAESGHTAATCDRCGSSRRCCVGIAIQFLRRSDSIQFVATVGNSRIRSTGAGRRVQSATGASSNRFFTATGAGSRGQGVGCGARPLARRSSRAGRAGIRSGNHALSGSEPPQQEEAGVRPACSGRRASVLGPELREPVFGHDEAPGALLLGLRLGRLSDHETAVR